MELERKYNKRKNPFHNYVHGIAGIQIKIKLISLFFINILFSYANVL